MQMKAYTNEREELDFEECAGCGEEKQCRKVGRQYICAECEHDAWLDHCEAEYKAKKED